MMSHVKIVDPWEPDQPTRIPSVVRVKEPRRGGPNEPFLMAVYVDDFIMASVQLNPPPSLLPALYMLPLVATTSWVL